MIMARTPAYHYPRVYSERKDSLQFDEDNLPPLLPVLATPSSALEIVAGLEVRLRAYHEERKNEAPFQEPAGSVVTAVRHLELMLKRSLRFFGRGIVAFTLSIIFMGLRHIHNM